MTAEEFLEHIEENGKYTFDWKEFGILFAKYHVEQALRTASNNVKIKTTFKKKSRAGYTSSSSFETVDKKSILNAYPLENIK
jgi:hypothetical protein